jgi:hypothetical protein
MSFQFEIMLFENSLPLLDLKIDGAPISVKISLRLKAISSALLYTSGLRIINLVR